MDATQMIDDYVLESDEDEEEEERENQRGEPLAKLRVLKNQHIPETELPLYSGENVLGRDPNTCNVPLLARSVSKQHTTVSLTVYRGKSRRSEGAKEVLVWDMGSMNGTRKGHRKLTPHVRYALSEGDSLMVADIPCQYVSLPVDETQSPAERNPVDIGNSSRAHSSSDIETEARPFGTNRGQDSGAGTSNDIEKSVENGNNKKVLNRLLLFSSEEESGDTPARTKALCSDRSRTQLQETLVPESDSDGEQDRRPSWPGQSVVSESDSMASPRSNYIPESPITPSSIQNRPKKHVSFSEESDVDAGRQQLRKKSSQVIVDDSEEEEEGRNVSLLGGREPERSGQVVPGEKSSDFSPPEEDESPVSTLASHAVAKPAFNMDSDTEEEEEGDMKLLECRAGLPDSHSPAADSPSKLSQFHMDSDTDVDEENESRVVVDAGAASVHASDDVAKPTRRIPAVQPTGLTAEDSDTDDEFLSETATKTSPAPHHKSTTITTSAPSAQPVDSHLDSDTDVEEEEVQGVDSGTKNASSKLEATPTVLSNSGGVEAMSAVPPSNLCSESDSDTDDESIVPVAAGQLTRAVVDTGVELEILSDSDTDLEEDAPLLPPVVAKEASTTPSALTKVTTDSSSTAGEQADEGQFSGAIPQMQRFSTPKGGAVEEMETQAFFNSPPDPFKRPLPSSTRPILPSSSDSQEDDDPCVVDETQSFILETPDRRGDPALDETQSFALEPLSEDIDQEQATAAAGDSFQRGLKKTPPPQAQCLAMESTQNFVSMVGDVYLEATQAYLPVPPADRTSTEYDLAMEATQVYSDEEKEPTRQIDEQATQAYIPVESDSDTEDDEGDSEARAADLATAETQPLVSSSTSAIATAETQLMSACEEEEEDVAEVKPSPQTRPATATSEAEERNNPALRKRTAKSQRLVESQESPLAAVSLLYTAETQPMAPTSETEESDEEERLPITQIQSHKITAEAKRLVESQDKSQLATVSLLYTAETQPMAPTSETEESDEEEALPVTRKRTGKAKRLVESQESPLATVSLLYTAETQPMAPTSETEESDEEELLPVTHKRRAQRLIESQESQPIATCEIEEGGKEDVPKAAAQTARCPRGRGKGRGFEAGPSSVGTRGRSTRGVAAEEQEEPSGPPRRQTRGRGQTTSRGRGRGRVAVPKDDVEGADGESEEEAKVELVTRGRGRKSSKQQKDKRAEEEELEQEHTEMQGTLQKEQDARERIEMEKRKREEEKTRQETEKREQVERERLDRERRQEEERLVREMAEREEREEKERKEKIQKEREEKERIDRERKEREEKERKEKIQKEREEQERELRERKDREEREKLERENSEREERERTERERKKREEKERLQQEKEQLERERREEEERLVREMAEREERENRERVEREEKERLEREEKEKMEKERKEREEQETLVTRESFAMNDRADESRNNDAPTPGASSRGRGRGRGRGRRTVPKPETAVAEGSQNDQASAPETSVRGRKIQKVEAASNNASPAIENADSQQPGTTRGRRASRSTAAAMSAEVLEAEPNNSTSVDGPFRRTRSRSNSSNSVSSETSFSSINSHGPSRGTTKTSRTPAGNRSSGRRATVTGESSKSDRADESRSNDDPTPGASSLGRGRGRGRRTVSKLETAAVGDSQNEQASAPKTPARGRKIQKVEAASNDAPPAIEEKADSQQPGTTRGRRRAKASDTELTAAAEEARTTQVEQSATEDLPEPNGNVEGSGQERKTKPVEAAVNVNEEAEAKETGRGKGRKRELEGELTGESSKTSQGKGKVQRGRRAEAAAAEEDMEAKEDEPAPANRGGRGQRKKSEPPEVPPADGESKVESEKMEEETPRKRGRGRPSAAQKKKEEGQEDGETSAHSSTVQDANVSSSETPNVSRKRGPPVGSSPVIKTPRLSGRTDKQACKVLFTGMSDETGEKALSRLGGSLARDVWDMTYLVTDKVRRTVKFLCAIARGIPIVDTQWLQKCGKAGSFLPPNGFIVKDTEQEKKFNFCLQESLRTANNQPLLQGYEIHVTKSVLPEPVHMKDIICCSGATYLPKMPSKHKAHAVVISCAEDWALCRPAVSASIPIVTAEFILTGILQQKVDVETHTLSISAVNPSPQAAAGRGRGKKKT